MTNYIVSIPFPYTNDVVLYVPVYKSLTGYKGLYYIIKGFRYHVRFPIKWALNHQVLSGIVSGPKECLNCAVYGTCHNIFIGYCSNCLRNYFDANEARGNHKIKEGYGIGDLNNDELLQKYPYINKPIVSVVEEMYEIENVNSLWSEIAKNVMEDEPIIKTLNND